MCHACHCTSQHGTDHECPSLGVGTSPGNAALGTELHITAHSATEAHLTLTQLYPWCILGVSSELKKKSIFYYLESI